MTDSSMINVLFLASEADPLVKVGGLGDVAGSLPRALLQSKSSQTMPIVDVRLVIPHHPSIHAERYSPRQVAEFEIYAAGQDLPVQVSEIQLDGLTVYLINGSFIEHEMGIYSADLEADGFKYVFFSLAALQLPKVLNWKVDILHANDWHTSPAVYSLALNRSLDPFYSHTASLLTVHNLPYLGSMTGPALTAFGLPPAEATSLPAWASHMALPLGLLTADRIVAVSPSYAREILTEEFGSGLHAFLRNHSAKITGILNGLETQKWNPTTDPSLTSTFSVETLGTRSANKSALQAELGLQEDNHIPLLAMVTRMDPQKGVDLVVDAVRSLLQAANSETLPFQVVFLGTGNPVLEQAASHLEQDFPLQVRAQITYNEALSRHIYAGADIFLMPSRYEPCGLSQMIAMHYGCIPVAHSTGGLSDTIHDPSKSNKGTGFLFKPARADALATAIKRALAVYRSEPTTWQELQVNAMQQDFSWEKSAREYIVEYKKLLDFH